MIGFRPLCCSGFLAFLSFLSLVGCASPKIDGALALLDVEPLQSTTKVLLAQQYVLCAPTKQIFVNIEDPEDRLEIHTQPSSDFGSSLARVVEGRRIEYLSISDHGDVGMLASTDLVRQTTSVFAEPLTLAPGEQRSGMEFVQEVGTRLIHEHHHDDIIAHGTSQRTIQYQGIRTIRTSKGPIEVAQVQTSLAANLSVAKAHYRGLLLVSLEEEPGIIAMVLSEQLSVFGLRVRSSHGVYIRHDLQLTTPVETPGASTDPTALESASRSSGS